MVNMMENRLGDLKLKQETGKKLSDVDKKDLLELPNRIQALQNDLELKNRTALLFSFWDEAIEKCQQMMQRYWEEHPDIYCIIEQRIAMEKPKTNSDTHEVDGKSK